jgi:hypothetical protein
VNFQAGMQQPGILQPAEADSQSIGRRRFTEYLLSTSSGAAAAVVQGKKFTFHDSESQHSLFMTLRANIHFS